MRDALGGIQRALVVGGGSDIGKAILDALEPEHAILIGRNAETMTYGGERTVIEADITDLEGIQRALDDAFASDVDVAIVTAGTLDPGPNAHSLAAMFDVNATGSVASLVDVAERMRVQGHGTIVVISTIAAARPRPSNWRYGASKTALDFAARGIKHEVAVDGVEVLIVRLGFVRSKMTSGMPDAPLAIDTHDAGSQIARSIRDGISGVVHVPKAIRLVEILLRLLPQPLLERLDAR